MTTAHPPTDAPGSANGSGSSAAADAAAAPSAPPAEVPRWEGTIIPANKEQVLPEDVTAAETARIDREHRLWWRWVQVTGLAWGLVSAPFIIAPRDAQDASSYGQYVLAGVFQWLVLRRHVRHASRWLIATAIAAAIGGAAYTALLLVPNPLGAGEYRAGRAALTGVIDGVLLASLQTLVLAGWFRRVRWWFVVSLLIALLSAALTLAGGAESDPSQSPFGSKWMELLVGVPLLVLIGAIATMPLASVLIRLTRRAKPGTLVPADPAATPPTPRPASAA